MTIKAIKPNFFKLLILLIVVLFSYTIAHAEQPLPKIFLFVGNAIEHSF